MRFDRGRHSFLLNAAIQSALDEGWTPPGGWTDDPAENTRSVERRGYRGQIRKPEEHSAVQHSTVTPLHAAPYATKTLANLCDEIAAAPEGTRNATTNACALRAYRVIVENGLLDEDTVTEALADAARASGLPDGEIRGTLASARRKAARDGSAEISTGVVTTRSGQYDSCAGDLDAEAEPVGYAFTDGASFILDIPTETPAIWGSGHDVLHAEGESLMIAGPMGLGKTTLGLRHLRARLGLDGGQLLGHRVAPCEGNILYLAMDRPAQIARAARRMFTEDERDILGHRVKFWQGPPPFDVAKHPGILTALAEAAGAADVYLDSVKDAALGLSEDETGAGYNRARQQLLASGRQLTEMHHTTKRGQGGGPPNAVADIYGSAWITNGTGSIILLTGDPGDPIVGMRHVRTPADEVGPYQLLHDQIAGQITVHQLTDLVELVTASGPHGLTARDAAAALFSTGTPNSAQRERARRRLASLAADGILFAIEGTRGGASTAWFPAPRTTP